MCLISHPGGGDGTDKYYTAVQRGEVTVSSKLQHVAMVHTALATTDSATIRAMTDIALRGG